MICIWVSNIGELLVGWEHCDIGCVVFGQQQVVPLFEVPVVYSNHRSRKGSTGHFFGNISASLYL